MALGRDFPGAVETPVRMGQRGEHASARVHAYSAGLGYAGAMGRRYKPVVLIRDIRELINHLRFADAFFLWNTGVHGSQRTTVAPSRVLEFHVIPKAAGASCQCLVIDRVGGSVR
jgi:hypothetical protein